jgi:Uma2 family endonuclease
MSAEPVSDVPGWMVPGENGFTADDLDRLPGLPPHTELIDGGLILVSPRKIRHMRLVNQIYLALAASAPAEWAALREISVVLDERQRPEPDVLVIDSKFMDDEATWVPGSAVLLAVEVVSRESEVRDRKRKPQLYAEAEIRHFWRVERQDDQTVVYVYELDPANHVYGLTGIYHERLTLSVPFDLDIALS